MNTIKELIVIGSGNWGLALACLFSKNLSTRVWTLNKELAEQINKDRDCPGDFFKYPVPSPVVVEEKYSSGFDEDKTLFIMAVPSSQVELSAKELSEHCEKPLIVTVSKGFDASKQCTMSELIKRQIPDSAVIVLTGPTIANEVAEGKPTRAVLASDNLMYLAKVKEVLRNDVISFEVSRNPTHHEVCAALKGIVAISVGMAEGLDLGSNLQGVLMTEGIRELGVVSSFFGIPESVAYGVSGAGDLITTCISNESRNRRLGAFLTKGLSLEKAMKEVGMTVEGVAMSQTIETLWSLDVSIPLIHMVNRVLLGKSKDIRKELSQVILSL
jgi:glycerol-3-phosphate dehydrogenase (NAD(P)+)